MPNEMTPLEAAEKLETEATRREQLYQAAGFTDDDYGLIATLRASASYLRKIAAGEYKQVVHAHWIPVAKECYDVTDDEQYPAYKYCSHCEISQKWPDHFKHCPNCGALMDGKDDSHETD